MFEVFVNGAATAAYSQSFTGLAPPTGTDAFLVELDFTPDSPADVLDVRFTLTSETDAANAYVGLQAVAIIPEPASAALLGLAGAFGLLRRRR